MIKARTPRELGYRMPAEFEPHEGTWLSWPNKRLSHYWGERLKGVEATYTQLIAALHGSETVYLQVFDEEMKAHVEKTLNAAKAPLEHIIFFETKNLDVWTRDHGPIFVKSREGDIAITHWMFNGWGKYNDLVQDALVPARIHELTGMKYFNAGIILEGGSIEPNGQGTLITTEQCLLNKNRNRYLKREDIEKALRDYLSIDEIIWFKKGLYKDDTAGHVDNLARYANPTTAFCVVEKERADKNYEVTAQNFKVLKEMHQGDVVKLPTPGIVTVDGERRAASYANFYIANTVVLAPIFGVKKKDDEALGILQDHFPQRRIKPMNCLDLIASGGTMHCITQQQPKRTVVLCNGMK